ncbi:hypothetical protein [Sulfurivermis fontis]|uniref:hypothetical protein n=1 Tax=Sulfurivermis fontis TaxID=1972068 RepID=UPI0015591863|nr:hypothetical protein [Sulfurivermis fontis]
MADLACGFVEGVDAAVPAEVVLRRPAPNWYSPSAPSSASILNSSGAIGSGDIIAPLRAQMEQLQRRPLVIGGQSKENFTLPQWQEAVWWGMGSPFQFLFNA